jgi:ribulose-5-phosphate 4-epimerase/fuculose-1-phosphate aldolase
VRDLNVKDLVSEDEWNLRVNLAACARALSLFGIEEFGYNHMFAKIPNSDHVLVPVYGISYQELRASDFIKVDFSGNVILNPHNDLTYSKAIIKHLPVIQRRPELTCMIHAHPPSGTAVSMLECGLMPYSQHAMRFVNIPYHDYVGAEEGFAEIDQLMNNLGNSEAIILRNHGVLVVGRGIAQAFNTLFYLEQACSFQLKAQACNTPFVVPNPEEVKKTAGFFNPEIRKKHGAEEIGVKEWPAIIRLVERTDPSYKE